MGNPNWQLENAAAKVVDVDEETCEVCDEPFSASSVPHLRREDTCGDCIELAADSLLDDWKDSYLDDEIRSE